jgi:hypothetical protein
VISLCASSETFVNDGKKENYKEALPRERRAGGEQMPRNKSTQADDQRNESRFRNRAMTPNLDKMSRLPASLNNINKNLP